MTEKTYPDWFAKKMVWLFSLYPQAVLESAANEAWWVFLRDMPKESILAAFKRAPKESPTFCPAAPQILSWAQAHEKTSRNLVPPERRIEEKPFSRTTSSMRDAVRETLEKIGQ